jgi:hypothetical protein
MPRKRCETNIVHSREKSPESDAELLPRQAKSDTEMDSMPESQVSIRILAMRIEARGVGKLVWVAIGGSERDKYQLSLRDRHTGDFGVSFCDSPKSPDRRLQAKKFLDGGFPLCRACRKLLYDGGIVHQKQHAIADGVGGRLVSSDEQKLHHAKSFIVGERARISAA